MPSKRVRTLFRAPLAPTEEVPIYDSDDDLNLERNQPSNTISSSTSAGNTAPIGLANSVTEIRAPVVLGNEADNMAPIGSANTVTNTLSNQLDQDILQMGNVVPPERTVQDLTQQSVFNMRNAVFLTDTVNEALANSFLVQAQDPTFRGRWDSHIQPQALELIRLRLHDITYRTLCPLDQISIWPIRLPNTLGEPQRYTLLEIAETVQKLYAPEAAPQTKSIEQRCREAAFI